MFTFRKAEKLCSKKDIELLYKSGSSKTFYPLKIFWKVNKFESSYPARVLITVPKRLYKRAVDRNLMKRRIREAYRHAKPNFYSELVKKEIKMDVLIMYVGKEKEEFTAIQKSLETGLKKIGEVISK
ncbi:MAG: ribonuclease P protein component [Bacteroidetes bacterium]|nr:ribonuclease P protein component [Bacteroidota bacterium]